MKPSRIVPSKPAGASPPDQATVSAVVTPLRWRCLADCRQWFLAPNSPNWTNLDADSRAQLVKANPLRRVYRVRWNDLELYAKHFRAPDLLHRLKWLLKGPPSRGEFQRLLFARRCDLPVAKPLAWAVGRVAGKPVALLITESLGPTVSLEELIWRHPPPDNSQLSARLDAVARAVAALHRAGIAHCDLHPGNILLAARPAQNLPGAEAWIADLQNSRIHPVRSSPDPCCRWRATNLAMLVAGLRTRLANDHIRTFIRSYLAAYQPIGPGSTEQLHDYLRRIDVLADRQNHRVIARHERRCLRNSRYAQQIRLADRWSAHVFLSTKRPHPDSPASAAAFTAADWQIALADPTALLDEAKTIKQGGHNTIVTRNLDVGSVQLRVVVKHTRLRSGPRGWLAALRRSRALRQWHSAHALLARRIPTAWPLAAIEQRRSGRLTQSILLTERIDNSYDLKAVLTTGDHLPPSARQRTAVARQLGRLVARLTLTGLRHRDCKASNILLRSDPATNTWQPYFIDLDGLHRRRLRLGGPSHRELIRLAASVLDLPSTHLRDYIATFKAYVTELNLPAARARQLRRRLWDKLTAQVNVRAARSRRKYLRRQDLTAINPTSILIIKPSSLGDVVRSLPILAGLRRRWPRARIAWLVRPDCAAILKHNSALDEIISFDRRRWAQIWYNPLSLKEFISFIRLLKAKYFDLVLDLQGLFRSGFLSWCTNAPLRVGFAQARECAALFYTHRVIVPREREHVVESYWRFADRLGFADSPKQFALPLDRAVRQSNRQLLRRAGLADDQHYAVLLIGGTEPAKRWPPERFAVLAEQIEKRYNIKVVLLGAGTAEAAAADGVVRSAQTEVINLVGKSDIQQLTALLADARLVVGNDTGPLHIAAALAVPTVGLYGPTDAGIVGPYGQMDAVVQAGPDTPRRARYSRADEHKITAIALTDVLDALERKLP